MGMGYVGLPLAVAAHRAGYAVTGFDIDENKISLINAGTSPIRSISSKVVLDLSQSDRFHATASFDELADVDVVMICVPTPLSRYRDPDLSFIEKTGEAIAPRLQRGQLIVLESTTYPGTTGNPSPILEKSGLQTGRITSLPIRLSAKIRQSGL